MNSLSPARVKEAYSAGVAFELKQLHNPGKTNRGAGRHVESVQVPLRASVIDVEWHRRDPDIDDYRKFRVKTLRKATAVELRMAGPRYGGRTIEAVSPNNALARLTNNRRVPFVFAGVSSRVTTGQGRVAVTRR